MNANLSSTGLSSITTDESSNTYIQSKHYHTKRGTLNKNNLDCDKKKKKTPSNVKKRHSLAEHKSRLFDKNASVIIDKV